MRTCTTLLEAVQPLASNVRVDEDDGLFFTLQIQILATLCDMIQGPNIQNQKDILESSVLSHVNRIFSSINYVTNAPQKGVSELSTTKDLNSKIALLKWEAIKLCLSLAYSVLEPDVPKRMLAFFDVSNFFTQMVNIAEIIGIIEDSDVSSEAERVKLHESLHAEGYKERLRTEMLGYWHLLRYLKRYEDGDEVSKTLKRVKEEHHHLYTYAESHTCSVEINRPLCLDKSGLTLEAKDDGKTVKHIEKVYFPVSEHMRSLVDSNGFKFYWKNIIWNLPHTKTKLKHKTFVSEMRKTLAMATWLQQLASHEVGSFLMRKREHLRSTQLRVAWLITVLILTFYGLPIDPNDGKILVDGRYQIGMQRTLPPAGYHTEIYPYINMTSDPLDTGKTKGSILHSVDESLEFRLRLTNRWSDPAGWRHFPEARYVVYIFGLLHMLLSVLRLVAYLVIEFPLTCFAEDSDKKEEERGGGKVIDKHAGSVRSLLFSMLKVGLLAAKDRMLKTLCIVDADHHAFDFDDHDSRKKHMRQRHGVVAMPKAEKKQLTLQGMRNQSLIELFKKDAQDVSKSNKQWLQKLEPPPKKDSCLKIFGRMIGFFEIENDEQMKEYYKTVVPRQWPLLYLMLLLSTSLLGIWSSPFYFVVCLLDQFRSRCVGSSIFSFLLASVPCVEDFLHTLIFLFLRQR